MRLYSGLSTTFIQDTVHNRVAEIMKDAFFRQNRYKPAPAEVNAWRNSLRAISQVFDTARLHDHGVILEYQLPLTSHRLDCLICGQDGTGDDSAVVVELKQWSECAAADANNLVRSWVGGAERDLLHPSAQVERYQQFLQDGHTAFHEGPTPVRLASCAYLHNYYRLDNDVLFDSQFDSILARAPTFTADDVSPLQEYLTERLRKGNGEPVLRRVEQSRYKPSKKLLEHVGGVVKGTAQYVLLDEQLVVYERVRALARAGFDDRRKTVVIVEGGPGTGKSVIAINLLADVSLEGRNAHYATGSKAFTETLRRVVGTRAGVQFRYFNSYDRAQINDIDLLIGDEAHRIREFSHSRFTPKAAITGKPQIRELIDAAKVCLFFVDDRQAVRPGEVGTTDYIRRQAKESSCNVLEYRLEAQFRCAGSDGFVNWINNTLGIERTANVIWEGDDHFDFQILPTPEALENAIRHKVAEGNTARVTAGFTWKWSKPLPDGTLVDDVVIGTYKRPWNAKPDAARLAPGISKSVHWAFDPAGVDQIGCIYTAQGFEFDYVGVIVGRDLTYDPDSSSWVGHPEVSRDTAVKRAKTGFVDLVKNTYRVLLSRGMKGCYVHFLDKETEKFFRSRMEAPRSDLGVAAEP